jgi:hypothetical protein
MKILIIMKTPDAFDQVKEVISGEACEMCDERVDKCVNNEIRAKEIFDAYFQYGEIVTLELDTVAGTIVALPR